MEKVWHYAPDMFSGEVVCGNLLDADAETFTATDHPPMVTCDVCLMTAWPWLEELIARRNGTWVPEAEDESAGAEAHEAHRASHAEVCGHPFVGPDATGWFWCEIRCGSGYKDRNKGDGGAE